MNSLPLSAVTPKILLVSSYRRDDERRIAMRVKSNIKAGDIAGDVVTEKMGGDWN
jgi:hypothetical protein